MGGLGEYGADQGRYQRFVALRHVRQQIAHEVHPAALPGRPGQYLGDGGFQPFVGIADHELDALQAALHQTAQKFAPERLALAGAQRQAQDVALARFAHADGDHGRQTDNATVLPYLQVDRIQPDVRVALRQRPVTELRDQRIQFLAGPRDQALVDPLQPSACISSSTRRVLTLSM